VAIDRGWIDPRHHRIGAARPRCCRRGEVPPLRLRGGLDHLHGSRAKVYGPEQRATSMRARACSTRGRTPATNLSASLRATPRSTVLVEMRRGVRSISLSQAEAPERRSRDIRPQEAKVGRPGRQGRSESRRPSRRRRGRWLHRTCSHQGRRAGRSRIRTRPRDWTSRAKSHNRKSG